MKRVDAAVHRGAVRLHRPGAPPRAPRRRTLHVDRETHRRKPPGPPRAVAFGSSSAQHCCSTAVAWPIKPTGKEAARSANVCTATRESACRLGVWTGGTGRASRQAGQRHAARTRKRRGKNKGPRDTVSPGPCNEHDKNATTPRLIQPLSSRSEHLFSLLFPQHVRPSREHDTRSKSWKRQKIFLAVRQRVAEHPSPAIERAIRAVPHRSGESPARPAASVGIGGAPERAFRDTHLVLATPKE